MQNWKGLRYARNQDGTVSFYNDGKCVMVMSSESFALQSGMQPNPSRLVKKAALLAFVAASCACAKEPPLYVDVSDQPEWVVQAFEDAADFWALHDIEVNVGDFKDGIKVAVVGATDIGGDFARWAPSEGLIKVSNNLGNIQDPRNANLPSCSLAHELGHALGMQHVEDEQSLMAEKAKQPPEEGCWWSADDQIELCRATGCIDEESEE